MQDLQNFSIERIRRNKKYEMKTEDFHDHYEMYYLISGERKYFVGHSICTVNPGDFILINKQVLHKTSPISGDTHERYLISFDDKFLRKYVAPGNVAHDLLKCFDNVRISVPEEKRDFVHDLLFEIVSESRSEDEYSEFAIFAYLCELLIFLNRLSQIVLPQKIITGKYEKNIQRIIDYMNENFRNNITLKQASQLAFTNTTYFSKKFKKCTGFGFSEYLKYLRITEASKMLVNTKSSISKISCICGFNNSSYFGDVFKKVKGISPQKYRNIYTEKQ